MFGDVITRITTTTFHPGGVREVSDRTACSVWHRLSGPADGVLSRYGDLRAQYPAIRATLSADVGGTLDLVLHRDAPEGVGMLLAA